MLKRLVLLSIILIVYCGFIYYPLKVANPQSGTPVTADQLVMYVQQDPYGKLASHIHVQYQNYVLYPESLIKWYTKCVPTMLGQRLLIGHEYLDSDHVADLYKALLTMHLPGCALFTMYADYNFVTDTGGQKIIGIVTQDEKVIYIWGDPYWYKQIDNITFE